MECRNVELPVPMRMISVFQPCRGSLLKIVYTILFSSTAPLWIFRYAASNLMSPLTTDKRLTTAGPAILRTWLVTMLIGKVGLKRQKTPQADKGRHQ